MRLELHRQREVARLHFRDVTRGNREIGRSAGVSPNTVKAMREVLRKALVSWNEIKDLDDDDWCKVLSNHSRSIAQRKPAPDWHYIHSEMQRPDATISQLWKEFREGCPEGIGLTQFSEGYRLYKKKLRIVMRQDHRPGEKLFVDFAGRTVTITNEDGSTWEAEIFIAALGNSHYAFFEAVESQRIPHWVEWSTDHIMNPS